MKIEKNSLLKLRDEKIYFVLEKLNIDNKNYLYLIEKDNRDNLKFYCEEIVNNKLCLIEVKDEVELNKIIPAFFNEMSKNILNKNDNNN